MALLNKFFARIRNREFGYLFRRLFPSGNRVFYCGRQYVFELANEDRLGSMYEFVKARTNQSLVDLADFGLDRLCQKFPEQNEKIRLRADRGESCYIAFVGEKVSGYIWVSKRAECYYSNNSWLFCPDAPGGLWGLEIYVKPEFRMRGVFVFMLGQVRTIYADSGSTTLYGATTYHNSMSIRSHLRAGYEIVRRVDVVSVFGLKLFVAKDPRSKRTKVTVQYALDIEKYR